jgi:hypothetical protein
VTLMPLVGLVALALVTNLEAARRFALGWRAARPPRPRSRPGPSHDALRHDPSADLTAATAATRAMTARPPERR